MSRDNQKILELIAEKKRLQSQGEALDKRSELKLVKLLQAKGLLKKPGHYRTRQVVETQAIVDNPEELAAQFKINLVPIEMDFTNTPFFFGHRNQLNWGNGFADLWWNAKTVDGKVICNKCGIQNADRTGFQIDHIVSIYDIIEDRVDRFLYCDGTNHWKVFVLGNRDGIRYPVTEATLFKFEGNRHWTVLEVCHLNDNLQVLCSSCNASKSGARNPGEYRPEHAGNCNCPDKRPRYLQVTS